MPSISLSNDSSTSAKTAPQLIFDSRRAVELYENYKEFRSSSFVVPPGYAAIVELMAPEVYIDKLTFTAIRLLSAVVGQDSECLLYCNKGKRYRRWKCVQSLGTNRSSNTRPTKKTTYDASVVRWGFDTYTKDIVEFEYITRPGTYFLEVSRCAAQEIFEDCVNPILIEYTLIPMMTSNPDLLLPCSVNTQAYSE